MEMMQDLEAVKTRKRTRKVLKIAAKSRYPGGTEDHEPLPKVNTLINYFESRNLVGNRGGGAERGKNKSATKISKTLAEKRKTYDDFNNISNGSESNNSAAQKKKRVVQQRLAPFQKDDSDFRALSLAAINPVKKMDQ